MSTSAAETRMLALQHEPFQTVSERQGFFRGSGRSIAEVWAHRELLWLLVRREIKARYKDSTLGLVWSLARPLIQLLIYYFAIGQILGAARNTPDFAIFVFTGLTTWGLFSEIVSGATGSILGNGGLVKKVYLPREIFPLSTVGGAIFNFLVQLVVLIIEDSTKGFRASNTGGRRGQPQGQPKATDGSAHRVVCERQRKVQPQGRAARCRSCTDLRRRCQVRVEAIARTFGLFRSTRDGGAGVGSSETGSGYRARRLGR